MRAGSNGEYKSPYGNVSTAYAVSEPVPPPGLRSDLDGLHELANALHDSALTIQQALGVSPLPSEACGPKTDVSTVINQVRDLRYKLRDTIAVLAAVQGSL